MDRYSRIVLTVIAIALVAIAARDFVVPAVTAHEVPENV